MQRLYALNESNIHDRLIAAGYSATYIQNNEWKYHYLVTNIIHKRRETTLAKGWVVLNIAKLRAVLGNSKFEGKPFQFVDRIREDLYRWGIILYKYITNITDEGSIRRKSIAKIKDEVVAIGWKQWSVIKDFVIATKGEKADVQPVGIYKKLQGSLNLLRLDYAGAIAYCEQALATRMKIRSKMDGWKLNDNRRVTADIFSSWKTVLDCLNDTLREKKKFKVHAEFQVRGRAYTLMTSFPKALRRFVTIGGKPMVEADISCSQPLLFALYLKQTYGENMTADMKHYTHLVETGEFYPYLKSLLVHYQQKFNSETFKPEFFGKVFYSKEKKFHKWRCLFALYFPGVSDAILKVKGANPFEAPGDPYKLTSILSLLESDIMLQGVASRLYAAGIKSFITVHDAIYTTDEWLDVVVSTIYEEYSLRGITPNIKTSTSK